MIKLNFNRLFIKYISMVSRFIPDKIYLDLMYYKHFHKFINWDNPQTFNEKLQWLKIYDRRPEYTTYVDKYAVRKYIAKTIGEEYLIPLLGVWDKPEEIDFDKLPSQFVLKCNHDSHSVIICRNKLNFNKILAISKLKHCLNINGYWYGREWPYKNVQRKIIAEKYIEDNPNSGLPDYKFSCFDGYVSDVMVCLDRHLNDTKFYFFDKDWNFLKIDKKIKEVSKNLSKPKNLSKMFEIASILSQGFAFVRVDLYNCHGKIYFGELTFYPCSGFDEDITSEADYRWLNLLLKSL